MTSTVKHSRSARQVAALLLSPPFLIALTLLLVNDLYLKTAHPGWLTGKLSDFAGLFVVGAIFFAALPRHRLAICAALSVAFWFWKSPYSAPVIELANSLLPVQIGRVVDYSDLLGLLVLPLASRFVSRLETACNRSALRRASAFSVGALTVLGVMGTSVMMPTSDFTIRNLDPEIEISRDDWIRGIARVAYNNGLELHSEAPDHGIYQDEHTELHYWLEEDSVRFLVRTSKMRGILLPVPDEAPVDRIRYHLKISLGELSTDMEYVEPIR